MTNVYLVHKIKKKYDKVVSVNTELHSALSIALMGEQANNGYSYEVYEYKIESFKPLMRRYHSLIGREVSDWEIVKEQ